LSEGSDKYPTQNGEILPPEVEKVGSDGSGLNQTWLAQVNNYTDRPDLLIAEIEKHDPGFVKRMNEAAEHESAELRSARFKFGKVQAYAALGVSLIAALAIVGAVFYAISKGAGFGTLIALGVLYAISQGGSRGFSRLVEAVSDLVGRFRGETPKDK